MTMENNDLRHRKNRALGNDSALVGALQEENAQLRERVRLLEAEKERQLVEEVELKVKFDVLEAVGNAIGAPVPLKSVLDLVMDLLMEALPVEAGSLLMLDAREERLHFVVARGEKARVVKKLSLRMGEGIAGWAAKENRYLIVNDVALEPRFAAWVDEITGFRTRSVLCLPLRGRGGVMGVVELLNKRGGDFTEEEAAYVASITNQAALLIDATRLLADKERTTDTLRALIEAGAWLNSSLQTKQVLENIVQIANRVIKVEAGSLFLLDESGKKLVFEVALGPVREQVVKFTVPLGKGVAGQVAATGEPLLVPDVSKDERFLKGVGAQIKAQLGFETRSILCVPMRVKGRIIGVVELINKVDGNSFTEQDLITLRAFADHAAGCIENARLYESLQRSYLNTINSLVTALDTRDNETGGHSQRVAMYAVKVANALSLSEKEIEPIHWGSLLHDIGKIGIPDAVLRKSSDLDEREWGTMRRHVLLGYRVLEGIEFLREASLVPLFHHERHDGKGYLVGLVRDEIPLGARIFAVVDAFDAMISDRPYRKALPFRAAREEIQACSGSQFDPEIVDAFLSTPDEIWHEIRREVEEKQAHRPSLSAFEEAEDVEQLYERDREEARAIFERWRRLEGKG